MLPRLSPVLLLAAVLASPAAAQPPAGAALDQSIDAGAHWTWLMSGGDPALGMQAGWRRWLSRHVGVGADVRGARGTLTTVFDSPAQSGPGGIAIPAMEGRQENRMSSYAFSGGLVARSAIGRLSLIAGGGPGFFLDRSAHDTRINAAQMTGSTIVRSVGLYMVMEMEVRATRHVSGYAGLRAELRDIRVADSSVGHPVAGVRVAF